MLGETDTNHLNLFALKGQNYNCVHLNAVLLNQKFMWSKNRIHLLLPFISALSSGLRTCTGKSKFRWWHFTEPHISISYFPLTSQSETN